MSRPSTKTRVILRPRVLVFLFVIPILLSLSTAFAAAPALSTVSPSSGSTVPDTVKTFTVKFTDPDGWTNLKNCYLLISTGTSALANSVYIKYDQNANLLYLRDNGNTAWIGGSAPLSTGIIENSQVKLTCSSSSVSGSTSILTLTLSLTFKAAYSGKSYISYLSVDDDTGLSVALTQKGTYSVNRIPATSTITPSSGTVLPNVVKTFSCPFSDADGWTNLKNCYFLISTGSTTLTNVVYLWYDQNANKLYLRDNANTAWLGGYAPGSAYTIENNQVKLNCASTTFSGSGTALSIVFNLTFKTTFSGKSYNLYLSANDDAGGSTSFSSRGTCAIDQPPTLGTITPASGSGLPNVKYNFTATYSDADGWQALQYAYLLINSSSSTANGCYAYYNQNNNLLYLYNDAGNAVIGGYAPGSANIIENSYAKIDCSTTTVSGSGTTLTVNWSVVFKAALNGTRNLYLSARDDANVSVSLTSKGTWTLPNSAPSQGTLALDAGASIPGRVFTFTTTFTDPDSWLNIKDAYFLINTSSSSTANCLYVRYSQNENKIYLRDSANSSWGTGYAPGASNVPANSQAKLYCAQTSVTGSGNQLKVRWAIEFLAAFQGDKISYLSVTDDNNSSTGWKTFGTWSCWPSTAVCTIIGPSGGEVSSSDGKVKLLVLPNGLSESTAISLSSVSNQSAPAGTIILNAVECKPAGLNFIAGCAAIVYTLEKAQVPGTPIELGLYSSAQQRILASGITSPVKSDGYTVSFDIVHFSTYVALASMAPSGTPIGGGVKIPLPDMLTGAFSYSIPITVSPGRKGMQPGLSVNYRSSNPNSWVGVGCSLNPGYIIRSTKLGPPTFIDTQDTFYLVTDAGTTELVNLADNLYQAKIESAFTKFFKETDDSWKAVGKDGSVLKFGQYPESKETAPAGSFCWYVTRALDTNGNYLDYSYFKDQGKCYLSRIDYTGNENAGFSPTNSVEFILDPVNRQDVISSYLSGTKVSMAKRLKEILVKVNSQLVWRYVLEYAYSPDTNRSLLKSVTQYSADGLSLPVPKLSYQKSR